MNLDEKIALAKTCIHFNSKLGSSGNCGCYGYAPFDCERCNSYFKNRAKIEESEETEND